jgi:hypothetical protein
MIAVAKAASSEASAVKSSGEGLRPSDRFEAGECCKGGKYRHEKIGLVQYSEAKTNGRKSTQGDERFYLRSHVWTASTDASVVVIVASV